MSFHSTSLLKFFLSVLLTTLEFVNKSRPKSSFCFFPYHLWKLRMNFLANTIQWPFLSLCKILIFQHYLLELTEKHLLATYFLWLECSHWFLFLFLLYKILLQVLFFSTYFSALVPPYYAFALCRPYFGSYRFTFLGLFILIILLV